MKTIIISGTPGTGKTSLAKLMLKILNARIIILNELVIKEGLILGHDKMRDTSIINERKLLQRIKSIIKQYKKEQNKYLIIESHFSDIIPNRFIDYVIVLRCDPDELFKRLEKRGYSAEKILENVQSEILGNCVNYVINKGIKKPVVEIDTTGKEVEDIAKIAIDLITARIDIKWFEIGKIDWLEKLNVENRLKDYFE
jgi:adenylate kinase